MNPFKNLPLIFLCFFLPLTGQVTSGKAIIIMGASCSGKSTLRRKLLKLLGDQWKPVELDVIENEFKAEGKNSDATSLLDAVVTQSNALLEEGWNVIIDTNKYHEILQTISTNNTIFVLVRCPLNILLERNAQRDATLQRIPQRAARALKYVEKTFRNFENFDAYDLLIDSSTTSAEESAHAICACLLVMPALRNYAVVE